MPVRIYHPTSVEIPESLPVRRGFRNRRAQRTALLSRTGDTVNYDDRTVLFDIWVEEDTHQILAIGPPSLNLHEDLYPVMVKCNGESITITKMEYRQCCTWCGTLPTSLRGSVTYEVAIQFREFEFVTKLSARSAPRDIVPLSQMAIQKNNPHSWVRDWCLWHRRICGVNNIYLYDNGSDDFESLVQSLETVNPDIDITIVRWPFPYGAPYKDCKFTQIGANNHFRMMFGRGSAWVISCDIDEYIVVDDGTQLTRRLRDHEQDGTAVVLLGYYFVPAIAGQPTKMERSIRDYTFRERALGLRGQKMKYIYRPSATRWNIVHFAFPKHWFFDRLRFAPLLYDRLFRQTIRRLIKYTRPGTKWRPLKVTVETSDNAHFLHFLGLNTDWKRNTSENVVQFSESEHVEAAQLAALIRRARLDD